MAAHGQTTQPKGGSHSWKRRHPEEPSPKDDPPSICWKRQRTDEPSLDDTDGTYTGSETSWHYPPRFWDRLSSIPLIHSALEELQRRIDRPPSVPSRPTSSAQNLAPAATEELARFARHGGPDLRDLRGYPHTTRRHRLAGAMNSPSQHRGANATDPSTLPTPVTTPTSKSKSPYNLAFEHHLADHQVHPIQASQEPELAEVRATLARKRPSLSGSMSCETSFSIFKVNARVARNEADVLANVIPIIIGQQPVDPLCSRDTLFNNLNPLTDNTIATAKPDIYYGADPLELDRLIRDKLAGHIIPSTNMSNPMVPNFFMEVKGPDGSSAVATRQACYDGAIGARAMHSLQSHNEEQFMYDGKPYTFSWTYLHGQLMLYVHHITAPTTPEGRHEYHMTLVDSWSLPGNIDSFRSGVAAFRNTRDLAKQYRDRFIQEANARGFQARVTAAQADAAEPRGDGIRGPHHSMGPTQCIPSQDADDGELQQQIDEGDGDSTPAVSHHLHKENGFETSRDPVALGEDPLLSFASTSTSNSRTVRRRSKRLEQKNQGLRSRTSGNSTSKTRT